jgi:lipoprotein-anchoring transpeptidase ErfK/SrfK
MKFIIPLLLGCLWAGAQGIPAPATAQNVEATVQQEAAAEIILPKEREPAVQLQIFLDQKQFGPGFIDGNPGMFTRLAIENYNLSLGREKNDTRVLDEAKSAVTATYATAIVPSIVTGFVDGSLPTERSLQAQRKSMPYRSVAEFVAERYHTSEDLLIELNGSKAVWGAKARSALQVPNIEPFLIETLKPGRSHKNDETLSARHVVVDTNIKQVLIYELKIPEDGTTEDGVTMIPAKPMLIASFPITPGKTQFIPKGFWNIKNSIELIEWRYDQQMLDTGVRSQQGLAIPPGPNNPIGVIWNGLTKSGIGIHGTNNPRTIGRARSSGCIRLANWDAIRIPNLVRPGAVVVVK